MMIVKNYHQKNLIYLKSKKQRIFNIYLSKKFSTAARKFGALLKSVASNKHVQRFAALKPVAGYIEKLSNAEIGANIELLNISGLMTVILF